MAQNGDNWKGAINLSGLIISDYFFSYPINRLGKEETKCAQVNAKNIKRCSIKWCNNLRAPESTDCAFHLENARSRPRKIRQLGLKVTKKSVERVNLLACNRKVTRNK